MSLFKNNHANQRYFERVHPDTASKKDIIKAIQDPSNIQYIKRLTESRSMAYVHLPNNNIVKVIINKKKKEIITILPWNDVYQVDIKVEIRGFGEHTVELFPDCYSETVNCSTLNIVKDINGNYIPFNTIIFDVAVYKAWEIHRGTYDTPEIETQN